MAFPLDAKYLDDVSVIQGDMYSNVAGHQYPHPELAESIVNLCTRPSRYNYFLMSSLVQKFN